ncbi:hypothetical protein MARPO_0018s0022 [Marchantia polymorpha]|uniref:GTP-binding protein LepA C-terminal domain-containing protein n=1 Tax=Marchantia polymorpha TaxID=3197 RepID=A0A2R6XFH1_MARPO|nr:hypothetical protein MARPO_0018s0022 [Marchantia polymorpha]|eukprot:PTQ44831.1 hypothetical protein MARPO_0018s0022 [Marchantia polymorpha]
MEHEFGFCPYVEPNVAVLLTPSVIGQATIGAKVIACEAISPMQKDVLAKCYGYDITRKKKLLRKQLYAKGKKIMKAVGRVDVPQDAFMAVLRLEKEVL